MKYFSLLVLLSKLVLYVWSAVASGSDIDVNTQMALSMALAKANSGKEKPQSPPVTPCSCQETGFCQCGSDCACDVEAYAKARAKAIAEHRPLLVWVKCDPRISEYPEAVHVRQQQFPGVVGKGVVVGAYEKGNLTRAADLPADTEAPAIRRLFGWDNAPRMQSSPMRMRGMLMRRGGGSC